MSLSAGISVQPSQHCSAQPCGKTSVGGGVYVHTLYWTQWRKQLS